MEFAYLVVVLPERFAVRADLLDRRFPMIGPSVPCGLLLPREVPTDESRIPALGPPSALPDSIASNVHLTSHSGTESWGGTMSSLQGRVVEAALNAAVVEVDTSTTDVGQMRVLVETLRLEIATWLDSFRNWLGVLGPIVGVDIERYHEWFPAITYAIAEGEMTAAFFSALNATPSVYLEPAAIEPTTWNRALALTNRGAEPDLSHLRLLAARSNLIRGDHRAAVIDACTAAEVALSNAIRERLPTAGQQYVDALLNGTSGVAALSDLARALGVDVPVKRDDIKNQIGNRRNRAVHQSHVSSSKGAQRCVHLCAQVVNAAAPLPTE